jgi:hypothetical protein
MRMRSNAHLGALERQRPYEEYSADKGFHVLIGSLASAPGLASRRSLCGLLRGQISFIAHGAHNGISKRARGTKPHVAGRHTHSWLFLRAYNPALCHARVCVLYQPTTPSTINRQVRASKMRIPETGREEDALREELGDAVDVV